jgi:hypoxanthine phosphoribosyltransferase
MSHILFTKDQIQEKVRELADEINSRHHMEDDIVMICLLNGGMMFYTDLIRHIVLDIECDFMRAKSYASNSVQGEVFLSKDIETSIRDKHVYIVDDFYDTGNTIDVVTKYLESKNPLSLTAVTLLIRDISPIPDFDLIKGFIIKDEWVVGYGLDNNKRERNLDFIYAL